MLMRVHCQDGSSFTGLDRKANHFRSIYSVLGVFKDKHKGIFKITFHASGKYLKSKIHVV